MEILIKASQLLLSLSLLIILHEFGHYLPAKLFKTRVEKFYLFFDAWGKKLFSFKKGETEYGIGWLPLGGYVKISGMIDESMDTEQMKQPAQPWEFRSKPAWQRLIIMLGGIIVNFVLGFLIYIMIFAVWGEKQVKPNDVKLGFAVDQTFKQYGFKDGDLILKMNGEPLEDVMVVNKNLFLREVKTLDVQHLNGTSETINIPENIGEVMWQNGVMTPFGPRSNAIIDSVLITSPAQKAGFIKGDVILAVNNNPITYWHELAQNIAGANNSQNVTIKRDGQTQVLKVTPDDKGLIGVAQNKTAKEAISITEKHYSISESFDMGAHKAYWTLQDYITQFKYVFTKKGATSVGGFIAIGNIFPSTWSWQSFWSITAFLSIMLGFMNLLPIPALDGGHVVFTLWEMITRKKPSEKFLEYAQITGFILLMGLLLLANGNDIYKWVTGQL